MGVAETERALTRVAEERQRWRDNGMDHSLLHGASPVEWAGGFTIAVAHAVEAAWDGDLEDMRDALAGIASQAVALLEMTDEQLLTYALPAEQEASGA